MAVLGYPTHMQEENFEFVANLNINTVDFYQA